MNRMKAHKRDRKTRRARKCAHPLKKKKKKEKLLRAMLCSSVWVCTRGREKEKCSPVGTWMRRSVSETPSNAFKMRGETVG